MAALVVVALVIGQPDPGVIAATLAAIGALLVQVIGVRPGLIRRSDAVLAEPGPGRGRSLQCPLRLRRV